jgi:hypothetical protein
MELRFRAGRSGAIYRAAYTHRHALGLSVLIIISILPALSIIHLVGRYGVDVPFADEWSYAPLLRDAHNHRLTIEELLEQHNEHRLVLPKLLEIGFARWAGGNRRAEMFFSIVLAAGTAVNLHWLLRRSFARTPAEFLFLSCLVNLLLFSPVQVESWMWGSQFSMFLITYLLTCGVCVASSQASIAAKFLICAVLAFVAAFSLGNGFLLWIVTFPTVLIGAIDINRRRKFLLFSAWMLLGTATAAIYALGYQKPSHHPALAASHRVLDYWLYVSGFLGVNLARPGRTESVAVPVAIGTVLLLIYFAALLYFAFNRDKQSQKDLVPWLALGGFAILSAGLAAVTRIGFGISQALESRYTTFSLLLPISATGALAIIHSEIMPVLGGKSMIWLDRGKTALLTLFVVLFYISANWGVQEMRSIQRMRLWGKGALHFAAVLDHRQVFARYLGGDATDVYNYATIYDSLGLLHPALAKSPLIADMSVVTTEKSPAGWIDHVEKSFGQYVLSGWAVLPSKSRVADCVVVAVSSDDTAERAIAVDDEVEDRPDVVRVLGRTNLVRCGWRAHFSESAPRKSDEKVTAYAFDADADHLYRLSGKRALPH